jgi:threonine/homoserine/homoserine lactone efflux protein
VIVHPAAFLALSIVVIVTPGPDTVLTIRNTLTGGRRGGILTALGVITGQMVWATAAGAGIATLLAASRPAFVALKFAGAAYLIYLGARALIAAFRGGPSANDAAPPARSRSNAYAQGLLSNLGNPKIAAFFTGAFPQFATRGAGSFASMLLLGAVFASITLIWLSGYAVVGARAGHILRRSSVRRGLDGLSGAVLIALGLRLATAKE